MSVAFDVASLSAAGTGVLTWTHTPGGAIRGVCVLVVQNDQVGTVDSVTYGGVPMTQLEGSPNVNDVGEPSTVTAWFLGSSVPAGSQLVAVNVTGIIDRRAAAFSMSADGDILVSGHATILDGSLANPAATLPLDHRTCWVVEVFHSGVASILGISNLTNWFTTFEHSFGSQTAGWYRYLIISNADVTAGWLQVADEANMLAYAFTEEPGVTPANSIGIHNGSWFRRQV